MLGEEVVWVANKTWYKPRRGTNFWAREEAQIAHEALHEHSRARGDLLLGRGECELPTWEN